jgi:hypothetical protein
MVRLLTSVDSAYTTSRQIKITHFRALISFLVAEMNILLRKQTSSTICKCRKEANKHLVKILFFANKMD